MHEVCRSACRSSASPGTMRPSYGLRVSTRLRRCSPATRASDTFPVDVARRLWPSEPALSIALDRRGARVLQFFADAILGAPPLLRVEVLGLHLFAETADLLQGPAAVAVRRRSQLPLVRHAANLVRRRLEKWLSPSFGDQQLSLPPRELEDIALAALGDIDTVEVAGELPNEFDPHHVTGVLCRRLLKRGGNSP